MKASARNPADLRSRSRDLLIPLSSSTIAIKGHSSMVTLTLEQARLNRADPRYRPMGPQIVPGCRPVVESFPLPTLSIRKNNSGISFCLLDFGPIRLGSIGAKSQSLGHVDQMS